MTGIGDEHGVALCDAQLLVEPLICDVTLPLPLVHALILEERKFVTVMLCKTVLEILIVLLCDTEVVVVAVI